jgi:uncharacterized protein YjbJ (UPF0337 family)
MNIDTVAGEGTDLKGRFKESLGTSIGDPALQKDGIADQISGNIRKGIGGVRDFVRYQPLAAGAIAVGIGYAVWGASAASGISMRSR